jgi:hypothetical protein
MEEKLTAEQIKNWRNTLTLMLGPYASIMPEEDIQRLRDKMQRDLENQIVLNPVGASENEVRLTLNNNGLLVYDREMHRWYIKNFGSQQYRIVDPRLATKFLNEKFVQCVWRGEACNIWRKAPEQ